MNTNVILPSRKTHVTPRLLLADAYTIGSNKFESDEAKEKSIYYITFRKSPNTFSPIVSKDDDRIVFAGLQRTIDRLFYLPITHEEIDEAKKFLAFAKVTTKGFTNYDFPEHIWRRVVDEYNGRPPILIEAMPEGSVVYPNEPVVKITSLVKGMGILAAHYESKLTQIWAPTDRLTEDQHMLLRLKELIKSVEPDLPENLVNFFSSILITDFGDRAGRNPMESEDLGMIHLYTFSGTDTFAGAYQAYKNANEAPGLGTSVNALAHRNVQAYENEGDCYKAIYESCGNDEIISMVDDCYDAKVAVHKELLPLALRSKKEQNGKIVVARPDSSKEGYTTTDQVLEICTLAADNGLVEYKTNVNGETYMYGQNFHFLDGDGKDFVDTLNLFKKLIANNFAFYTWGLVGMGGGKLNKLKRDNLSAKYALSAVGENERPVVKFSESAGKTTLPGNLKVLRSNDALSNKKTIAFVSEPGENAHIEYFNGGRINEPFGDGFKHTFIEIKARIDEQMKNMPLSMGTAYSATDAVLSVRNDIMLKYAPEKFLEYVV